MADATLSTEISRRTILGATAIITAVRGLAALPDPDAELLRRIATAERHRAEYAAADAACARLHDELRRHPEYPKGGPVTDAACWAVEALAERTGYRAADDYSEALHARYETATSAVFKIPARTLPGLALKLKTALQAAKDLDYGTFEESDYRWLDNTMADLERMAGE